jgi:hypothetical protein
MGRHSRGSAEGIPPSELPEPDRHPYAPRSVEDTGVWDHRTYRVVDVGPRPESTDPRSEPLRSEALRSEPLWSEPPWSEPPWSEPPRPSEPRRPSEPPHRSEPSRYGATRADPAEPQFGTPDRAQARFGGSRSDEARFGGSRSGSESRLAPPAAETGAWAERFGATRADLVDPRFSGDRFSANRFGASPQPREPSWDQSGRGEFGRGEVGRGEVGREAGREQSWRERSRPEPRYGATRADLAESVGSTALAPRADGPPDPDEVTDTGARRARNAFRLAPEADETPEAAQEIQETRQTNEDEYEDGQHEPGLLLQWGIFLAQTITGAAAGLGVWLGFYRLWSDWPFYAAPGVGVAAIAMLVLARTLRRRHGRDLDLLTAIVTFGVITVLTVLPAAFTLRGLQ